MITVQDMTPLEDEERLRAEFLGMVSQELRAPLATIKGSTAALMDILGPTSSTEAPHLLRIVDQQTDLMRAQINSLIDLSQIESGIASVSTEAASVPELVDRACQEFQRTHASIEIETNFPPDIPMVSADKERINQVLKNLLSEISNHSHRRVGIKITAAVVDIYVAVSVSSEKASAPWEELDLLPASYPEKYRELTERISSIRGFGHRLLSSNRRGTWRQNDGGTGQQ